LSYSIYGYVVELDQLAAIIGSKDKAAVGRVAKSKVRGEPVTRHWEEIDEIDEDAEISSREALEDLVFARKLRRNHTFLYVYALETLCELYGRRVARHYMQQSCFEQTSASWLAEFHEALRKAGVDDVLLELYRPVKKTKAVPLPVSINNLDYPYAALVPSKKCEEARASLLAGIGKVKPRFRMAAMELYLWTCEVGHDSVLALYYY
jgi:hypothetical protein